jgi:hypothetical protein
MEDKEIRNLSRFLEEMSLQRSLSKILSGA